MADVQLVCRNFPAPLAEVNGQRILDVPRWKVLLAVLTVGLQRDLLNRGWRGALHRLGIGLAAVAYLERQQEGLCLSPSHEELDGSEKGGLSFWYGMAMAKIVADSELDIPWLVHVDYLKGHGVLTTSSTSREKCDLAGVSRKGDWHVVEAKGRTRSYSPELVTKAKRQASTVKEINGAPPKSSSACITAMHTRPISVLLDDPPPAGAGDADTWSIRDDGFFRQYYRGLIEYIESFPGPIRRIDGSAFRTATLSMPFLGPPLLWPDGLLIGLNEQIVERPEAAREVLLGVEGPLSVEQPSRNNYVGSDGIALIGQVQDWEVGGDGAA